MSKTLMQLFSFFKSNLKLIHIWVFEYKQRKNLTNFTFYHNEETKQLFKNIVALAVEVFRKPEMQFVSFIALEGWINKQNLMAIKVST